MNKDKKFSISYSVIAYFLCVVICFFTFTVAIKKTKSGLDFPVKTPEIKSVLTLWNIDTFEGGSGSRADFLASVSLKFKNSDTLIMVVSHTVESAAVAIEKGQLPDMISYGVGADFVVKIAKRLPEIDFKGGEVGGKFYAYPWCVGGYYLITKKQDNQLIDRLIVSQNTYNLPIFAIYENKIEKGSLVIKSPMDAYVAFLSSSEKDGFLGTQRDIKRLQTRGVTFYAKSLVGFSDLVQYISICTDDKQRYNLCVEFLNYLISDSAQSQLSKISMFSAFSKSEDFGGVESVDFSAICYTVSPFTLSSTLKAIITDFKEEKLTNNSLLEMKNVLKRL